MRRMGRTYRRRFRVQCVRGLKRGHERWVVYDTVTKQNVAGPLMSQNDARIVARYSDLFLYLKARLPTLTLKKP